MLFPALPEQVSAEEANTKVSLTVNPVIGIALDEAVTVEVLPTADGTFSSNKANLSVTTNNETGYSLYLATTNGENTLTSNNPSTTETINAITLADGTDSIPSSDFTNNTWGYNLSLLVTVQPINPYLSLMVQLPLTLLLKLPRKVMVIPIA